MTGKRRRKPPPPVMECVKRLCPGLVDPDDVTVADDPDEPADLDEHEEHQARTQYCTAKCSLKSFCTKITKDLPWDDILKDMNKAATEANVFANLHMIRLLQTGRPIPVMDSTFFNRCLTAVTEGMTNKPEIDDEEMRQSVAMYRSWRDPRVPHANSGYTSGWKTYIRNQMVANASNHIVHNFSRRFKRYIIQRFGITGVVRYQMMRDVLSPVYSGSDNRVLVMREWIPRNQHGHIDNANPHLILPIMYRFLRFAQTENFRRRHQPHFRKYRSFSLLPLKQGFRCAYFTMDKFGLHDLLARAGIPIPPVHSQEGPVWNDIAGQAWYELFNISRFETENRKFAHMIATDGKAVSVLLRRPKRIIPEYSIATEHPHFPNQNNFDEVWGLDPGRRDMFVATSNSGRSYRCSSREFYEDAKYTSSNKTIRHWIDHNEQFSEASRHMPSAKTCSLVSLHRYVRHLIPQLDILLDFEMAKPFRKLRFKRFVFMTRKIRELCLGLTARAGDNTLVGFGDWGATDYDGFIKRYPGGGPVKRFERQLKQYCSVASIPKFRTSKLHAGCLQELKIQRALWLCRDGIERYIRVHSVLHCGNNGCFGTTVNRDQNTSKNILLLTEYYLHHRTRHPAFTRGLD